MSDLTGGRAVVELLKAEQVRYIFGIVGATFLDVLDALYDDKQVEYINCRHEQGSAFMADGLARVSGTPGVCLVTRQTPGVPLTRASPSAMNADPCSWRQLMYSTALSS